MLIKVDYLQDTRITFLNISVQTHSGSAILVSQTNKYVGEFPKSVQLKSMFLFIVDQLLGNLHEILYASGSQ